MKSNDDSSGNPNKTKKRSVGKGPISLFSLILSAFAGLGALAYYEHIKEEITEKKYKETKTYGKALLGGAPWILVDEDGKLQSDSTYKGKFNLLYFGFTFCPDICPSELVKIKKIKNGLKAAGVNPEILKPLYITVDPYRDSVGQMKHYRQDFDEDIVYLTGTRDQIAKVTKAYRVYFSKANENEDSEDDYLVDHSIVMYLISPSGQFLEFFTQRMTAEEIIDKIVEITKDKTLLTDLSPKLKI